MARVANLPLTEMTEEQRAVCEETIAGKRGRLPVPMQAWIKSPEYARRVQKLGEFARYDTSMPKPISEMAILLVARAWTSHYEWYVHKRDALAAGLDPAIIDAIAQRRPPALTDERAVAVHDVTRALLDTRQVPDELYRRAVAALGERTLVELVGLLGFYTLVSMTLNTFDLGLPEGVAPELT